MSWCTVLKWELRLESFSSPVMGSSVLGGQVGYRAWEPRVPFANLAPLGFRALHKCTENPARGLAQGSCKSKAASPKASTFPEPEA